MLEGAQGESLRRSAPPGEQETQHRRYGEFGRVAESAEAKVFQTHELDRDPVESGGDRKRTPGALLRGGRERLGDEGRALGDLGAAGGPGIRHRFEHLPERRMPRQRQRRKVGAGVEGPPVGGDEHSERPAEPTHESTGRGEVAGIDFGMLLPIHFDAHEVQVQVVGQFRVAETLPGHDVAPVAGRVADRDEHGHVAQPRLHEGLRAPAVPGDGVVGMRAQVGTDCVCEVVGHASIVHSGPARCRSGPEPPGKVSSRDRGEHSPGRRARGRRSWQAQCGSARNRRRRNSQLCAPGGWTWERRCCRSAGASG